MTHRLLLIRHAKSSWDDPSLPDRERPLAKRGHRSATRLAAHLRSAGLRPDVVLCSPSRRTRETLERLELGDAEIRFEDRLYAASDAELLDAVRRLPEAIGTAALVGHNPGMQDLAIELVGPDLGEPAVRVREKFPTGALAVFEIDGAWGDVAPGRARLATFTVPRELA
ncbi:MAG: SixA phosphatase family protein [Actinomycetota bacterium]